MPRTRVKICGLTSLDGVDAAVREGADAIGLVFADSPRLVTPKQAVSITDDLPPFISTVAVFKKANDFEVSTIWKTFRFSCLQADAGGLGVLSLEGLEPQVIQVHRLGPSSIAQILQATANHHALLIEGARSGAGETIDWNAVVPLARQRRIILAGGLTPDNVAEANRTVRPYGVDVSSGVESSPGKKDPIKIRDFLQAVRDVYRELQ
ncbi:MAG: phosphoribosylanthranilate isomerase [Phycisphaerales bacterium]|nr:phosphoribosylanthranilate isomerase [Phycisphaerales bacterium]